MYAYICMLYIVHRINVMNWAGEKRREEEGKSGFRGERSRVSPSSCRSLSLSLSVSLSLRISAFFTIAIRHRRSFIC